MPTEYTEDSLIEQPAIALFAELGWETANCYDETFGGGGTLGRETSAEVVLVSKLRPALARLNPALPPDALEQVVRELARDRSLMTPEQANNEIYRMLKDGILVSFQKNGEEISERARIIDWENPLNNDFFLVSQFWISGEMYKRRADLIGFVNGLPLVFIELKAAHRNIKKAFDDNLRDYRDTIPHVFRCNAFIVLSNGSDSRIGSTTAAWEHFNEWKKINDEGEEGIVSLETIIRGTCEPGRLLDIVENFIVFSEAYGGLVKIVAKNHQYLGVNNAFEKLKQIKENSGRLGVFWHTQGSGKSYSMIFFSQKVLRKLVGNYTFVVVTDRDDLDEQIYKTFAGAGAVTETGVQATSGRHLQQLLREDHRYVFTLIQKFRTEKGETYPLLSERSDIIVITDEAHRSQYDIFAMNMRNALPSASFIGFTGTPLIVGEEKTREVFGDYVSVYNFKQSVDDGATVPLYYENRIPELQLTNEDLDEDVQRIVEEALLDEALEEKLEKVIGKQYHLITREDRLERVAEDIVDHFMGRGHLGKAMVVAIDKATAVRMFDKVQKYWRSYLDDLKLKLISCDSSEREALEEKINYMAETDMAVVVSQSQNEVADFRDKGLEIETHRRRMTTEDLDTKFKDKDDPFRIVFVCAMWMTGFDVPSCSAIYLDKPMRNHTLMQTIARANRVFGDKVNGLIIDYVGVFRNLQKALAIYGAGPDGTTVGGDMPVKDKSALTAELKAAVDLAIQFCDDRGVDLDGLRSAEGLGFVKLLDDAVEAVLESEDSKKRFLALADTVNRLYRAVLPDRDAIQYNQTRALLGLIASKIRSLEPEGDISGVMYQIERLLDESIRADGYILPEQVADTGARVDLSQIDFELLQKKFATGRKRTETEKLKSEIGVKIEKMIRENKTRIHLAEKFQQLIDDYNSGSYNLEQFFKELVKFAGELNDEAKRSIAEQLTEEELAIFDLLTKPEPSLSDREATEVKKVARDLLNTLKREKLVLEWRKKQQTRAAVKVCVEETLDQLPRAYTPTLYRQKCDTVYRHIYDSYYGEGKSVYTLFL